jgi:hypothetical protein
MTNSAVTVVASMLLSPLMGPTLAGSLGLTIGDSKLVRRGYTTAMLGVLTAFLCMLVICPCGVDRSVCDSIGRVRLWPAPSLSLSLSVRSRWSAVQCPVHTLYSLDNLSRIPHTRTPHLPPCTKTKNSGTSDGPCVVSHLL